MVAMETVLAFLRAAPLIVALSPVSSLGVVVIGYFLPRIQSAAWRALAYAVLTVMPILLIFLSGWLGDCEPFGRTSCMLGFGIELALMVSVPLWLLAAHVGSWIARMKARKAADR
jgi:hypothetical protein